MFKLDSDVMVQHGTLAVGVKVWRGLFSVGMFAVKRTVLEECLSLK